MAKTQKERDQVLKDLWCQYGCPEDMKITVESTGEKIWLRFGLPVTLSEKNSPLFKDGYIAQKPKVIADSTVTLTHTCLACKKAYSAKRETSRFCGDRCRKRWQRLEQFRLEKEERERAAASIGKELPYRKIAEDI